MTTPSQEQMNTPTLEQQLQFVRSDISLSSPEYAELPILHAILSSLTRLQSLEADAKRYQWLREPQENCAVEFEDENEDGFTDVFYSLVREELDAAIDSAISQMQDK